MPFFLHIAAFAGIPRDTQSAELNRQKIGGEIPLPSQGQTTR